MTTLAKAPHETARRTNGAKSSPSSKKQASKKRADRGVPYLLIAPASLLIVIFIAIPVLVVVYYSFFQYNVTKPWDNHFVGLGNFQTILFGDPNFWRSLGVTGIWVISQVVLQLVLGMTLAVVLNRAFRARGLARALAFAPWAISGVLATQIFLLIYNPSSGIASVLNQMGLHSDFSPLSSGGSAFWSATIAELWRGLPFFAILILADMQGIPKDIYEAADVDGAGPIKSFIYITLPYLRNVIIITTLLRGVWEFNNVDLLYTLTGGGPAGATTTLPLYVVNEAVIDQNFGYGSALTVAGFVILLIFSLVYLRLISSPRKGER